MSFKVVIPEGHVKFRMLQPDACDWHHPRNGAFRRIEKDTSLYSPMNLCYIDPLLLTIRTREMRSSFLLLIIPAIALAQLDQRRGDLLAYTDSVVLQLPSGVGLNQYTIPSAAYLNAWKTTVSNVLQGNDSLAAVQAAALSYRFISFVDTTSGVWPASQEYRILEKLPNASNHWGTYVFAVAPRRPQLVLQAPHPKNDSNTGQQSAFVFRSTGARAFFLPGTHRCNSSIFSPCDGTTSVCGTSEPFRESDAAHSVSIPFYIATVALEELEHPYVVQLHGFAKLTTDPDVIMSNSTALSPPVDLLSQIRDALLVADNALTFKIAHLDTDWTRLTGTTNVEGRLINGSSDPCSDASPSNAGRFFHLEQAFSRLRDNATNWQKMAAAFSTVFTPTTRVIESEHLPTGFTLQNNFPNPFNPSTTITFRLPHESDVILDVVNVSGQLIETLQVGRIPAGEHTAMWHAEVAGGVYFVRLRATDAGTANFMTVRKIVLTK